MRLDKFLKVSRIIKRRTVANEACSAGRVTINDKVAKPSTEVKEGDIIGIRLGAKLFTAEILSVREFASKETADEMYRVISNE
ncbi:MAG: RNA-binding S4 domain-containing protein [Clostridia bacterium]|nr:RNA-binding S4 domain-containing protein [Clostridia bacterium]MBQ3849667.1 RNA-binding S4 domain-containing protein [Clostridia bacterium]MBR5714914.1 RNA-binding S4 domain-containing protein [Clostridia bacterium]MBR5717863.1 RNA-binding S4 domain-containing protein [Clostridia bacterium]